MRKSSVILKLLILSIVASTVWCRAQPDPNPNPEPGRGRKRAFGAGLLGGALAGVVISNAMTKHNAQKQEAQPAGAVAPADQKHVAVIETGAPLANGCYQQTIKEPMANNPKLYVETVHLICPTITQPPPPAVPVLIPAAAPVAPPLPVPVPVPVPAPAPQPLPVSVPISEVAPPAAPAAVPVMPQPAPLYPVLPVGNNAAAQSPHATHIHTPAMQVGPAAQPQPQPQSQPQPQPQPHPQLQPQPHPQLPPQPNPQPAPVPQSAPIANGGSGDKPQVILLSKKAVYYDKKHSSSAAASHFRHNSLSTLLLLTMIFAIWFQCWKTL